MSNKRIRHVLIALGLFVLLRLARGVTETAAGPSRPQPSPPPPPSPPGAGVRVPQTEASSGTQTLKPKTGSTAIAPPRPATIAPSGLAARLEALPNHGCPPGRSRVVRKIGTQTKFLCV